MARRSLPRRKKVVPPFKKSALVALFLMLPSILFAAQEAIEVWTVREYWGQLTTGMTERVAIDLLGEPKEKESTSTSCIWYYTETPDRDGDKITRRPKYGILMFRLSASSEAMLLRWQEPDWTIITPQSLLHNDFQIQPLDSTAIRDRRLNSLFPGHIFLTFYIVSCFC